MPFPTQTARAFTHQNVLAINPDQMGCYGIFRQNECLYIGCGDIRARMLAHVDGDNPSIIAQRPTHWLGAVTTDYRAREKALILEFNPRCNKRLG